MKRIVLLIIGIFVLQICNSQTVTKTDWKADIDFLAKELPEKHYNFFTVKSKKEFLFKLNHIKINSEQLTDFEVALKLQQIIASFGDSHTRICFEQFIDKNQILPLQLFWFSDGLFVLHTTKENSTILGCNILSVNGVPLKIIVDSLNTLVTLDNVAIQKITTPIFFPWVQLLKHFGFIKEQNIELKLKDVKGKTIVYQIKAAELSRQNRITYKPDSLAFCYKNEKTFFVENYNAIDKIYYLQYNKCWSRELELKNGDAKKAEAIPSFKEFEDKVFNTLEKSPVNKIVFDLRFNEGGSSSQGTEFAEKLAKYLNKNLNMKMYVIIGRNTFSSAIINAMDCKRLMNAVFVGEETSGKPNHFGEVKNFTLPDSGLRVNYSTKYFEYTSGKEMTIKPDIKLETSLSDFNKGFDPAYEWIKRQ